MPSEALIAMLLFRIVGCPNQVFLVIPPDILR
jgi:hypothetical protein